MQASQTQRVFICSYFSSRCPQNCMIWLIIASWDFFSCSFTICLWSSLILVMMFPFFYSFCLNSSLGRSFSSRAVTRSSSFKRESGMKRESEKSVGSSSPSCIPLKAASSLVVVRFSDSSFLIDISAILCLISLRRSGRLPTAWRVMSCVCLLGEEGNCSSPQIEQVSPTIWII